MGLDPLKSQSGKGFKKYINLIHGGQSNVFCRLWFLTFILHLKHLYFLKLTSLFNDLLTLSCNVLDLGLPHRFIYSLLAASSILCSSFSSSHECESSSSLRGSLDLGRNWTPPPTGSPGPPPFCPYCIEQSKMTISDPEFDPKTGSPARGRAGALRGHRIPRPGGPQDPPKGVRGACARNSENCPKRARVEWTTSRNSQSVHNTSPRPIVYILPVLTPPQGGGPRPPPKWPKLAEIAQNREKPGFRPQNGVLGGSQTPPKKAKIGPNWGPRGGVPDPLSGP